MSPSPGSRRTSCSLLHRTSVYVNACKKTLPPAALMYKIMRFTHPASAVICFFKPPERTFPSPVYELSFFNFICRSRQSYFISTLSNDMNVTVFLKRLFIY